MKILLTLSLFAASAFSQTTIYLRHGVGAGGLQVTGCTNATPIVVSYAAAHNLAVNDNIVIHGQRITGGASAACNGTYQVKAVVSPNQISLKQIGTGADVAGNGAWIASDQTPIGGRAIPVTTKAGPIGMFDGYGGTHLRRLRCGTEAADPCLTGLSVSANVATATFASGYTDDLTAGVSKIGVWASATSALNATYTITAKTATTVTFTTSGVANGSYAVAPVSISKLAFTGNPAWDRILLTNTSWVFTDTPGQDTVYGGGADSSFQRVANAAIIWYVRRDADTLAKAKYGVNRVEDIVFGTVVCDDPATQYCGAGGTDGYRPNTLDFTRVTLPKAGMAATLLWDEGVLSAGEKTAFLNKIFDNQDSCVLPTWTAGSGTVTVSGTTATGAGLTVMAAGDVLDLITGDGETMFYRIVSAGNPATLDRAATYTGPWKWTPRWTSGHCGLIEYTNRHNATAFGSREKYGPQAGAFSLAAHQGNLFLTSFYGSWLTSLMLADKDPRAKQWAEYAWAFGADYPIATAMAKWSGLSQAGSVYGDNRSPYFMTDILWALDTGTTGYPAISKEWQRAMLDWKYYGQSPHSGATGLNFNTLFGEGTHAPQANNLGPGYRSFMRLADGFPECGYLQGYINRMAGGSTTTLFPNIYPSPDGGRGAHNYVLGYNPNGCAPTNPPVTAKVFTDTAWSECVAHGFKACGDSPDPKISWASSRTGWETTNNDTLIHTVAGADLVDHDEPGGSLYISKGPAGGDTPCLLGGDSAVCNGYIGHLDITRNSTVHVGTRKNAENLINFTSTFIDRSTVDPTNRYVSLRENFAGGINSPVPTRANRWIAHMKDGADILFVVDDFAASSTPMKSYWHYSQNGGAGEGTTTCAGGCSTTDTTSGRVVSQSTNNTLVSQFYFPSAGTLRVDNMDGTYPGGAGFTFRVTSGPTAAATIMEQVVVTKILAGTGSTALTSTSLTPTGFMGAEADGHVFLVPRSGASPTSVSFSKAATGNVVVDGLPAATYRLTRNGNTVCAGVAVSSTSSFFCPAVANGSIVVEQFTGNSWYISPSVTNTSGNGTIGNPCGLAAVLEGNCATSPAIAPGDTIYLRGGVHLIGRYGAGLTTWRETSLAGTSGNPITFRSYPGEWARVDGGIIFNGSDIIWRDTEVFCSLTDKQSAENGSFASDMYCPAALSAKAARIKFINNVIRNSGEIALWDTAPNSEAYGNINYYGGWRSLGGTGHGHGFYIQNNTGQHRVEANIVHNTFGQGVQVYGTSVSNLNNVFFDNNVWMRGGFANNNAGTPVPTRNFLIGGAVNAADMTVRHNHSFEGEVNLGYNGGSGQGCTNMEYSNSYSVTPNTIAYALNIADGVGGDLACNFNGSTTGNTRYGDPNGASLPGTNRILTAGTLPSTAEVSVVPNIYETGRANIIVWNWPAASSVTVDVSSIGLTNGDTFAVKDSQNYFGTPARVGTYTGASISVPMNLTTVETPIWTDPTPAITHTSSQFNAFVIVRTGTSTVNITTTTLPSGTQGSAYSQTLAADNCSPCVWSLTSGSLPSGLTLASDGTISGTPSASGSFSITPQATIAATGAIDITPPTISLTISAPSGGSGVSSTVRGVAIRGGTIR